jgi:CO dehydrogenase maturation factor
VTVVDMEAGLEHLSRSGGTLRHVDHLLVVVEPYAKAIETARRTLLLATELGIPRISILASKVRDDEEMQIVERFCAETGSELIGVIPYDDAARLADRAGLAAIETAPDSPMVRAVAALAARLEENRAAAVPA